MGDSLKFKLEFMKYKLLIYLVFVILIIIPYFDKEDKYFVLQIICLMLIGLFGFLSWRQESKKRD